MSYLRSGPGLWIAVLAGALTHTLPAAGALSSPPAAGPLRVHPTNPRYFATPDGQALLLTGSHTWNNLVDMGRTDPPQPFDFEAALRLMGEQHHNFIRLWTWELPEWSWPAHSVDPAVPHTNYAQPLPWKRTDPGLAADGKPKFNLEQLDDAYFDRLRRRVDAASTQGIYVSVMLFEGWAGQFVTNAWHLHPFNPANNVTLGEYDADLDGDGKCLELYQGVAPRILELQQSYVRRVIETVNEFDNVLYEISNENHPGSTGWQYAMIRFIREVEASLPRQHPIGMTFQYRGGQNETLFTGPADWVSPNPDGGYRDNPPVADGRKVVINDTDHLWGIGGNPVWVWRTFLRGHNPIFMDMWDGRVLTKGADRSWQEPMRAAMGQVATFADRLDLARVTPRNDLANTGYCLADPGRTYLVFAPEGGTIRLNLRAAKGEFRGEWFQPATGETTPLEVPTLGGQEGLWTPPFAGPAVLLFRSN